MLDRPHCHRTPKSRASNDRFARPLQGRSEPLGAQTAAKSRQPLSSSPALRTGADKQERSRDALRPSLANAIPKFLASNERREAERRSAHGSNPHRHFG